jgi:hypothetical protein
MSRCILVAVDGLSSLVAVDDALERARAGDHHVRLLALPGTLGVGMVHASTPDAALKRRRAELARTAEAARRRALELGVALTILSRSGPPDDVLLHEAYACAAGLVVVEGAPHGPRWRRPAGIRRLGRDLPCELVAASALGDSSPGSVVEAAV